MHRLQKYPWTSAAVAVAATALFIAVVEVGPALAEVGRLLQAHSAQKARLEQVAGAPAELRTLQAEQRRLRQDLGDLLVSLPRRDQLSAVLIELQGHAEDTGVALDRLEPGEPAVRRTHEALPIQVELSGGFHEVGRFLDRLERSALLMHVGTVTLRGDGSLGDPLRGAVALEAIRLGIAGPEETTR